MLGLRLVGQLLAFAINAIIGNIWGERPGVWRYMLAVAAIPAVGLFVGMLQMPQSPRWLISKTATTRLSRSSCRSGPRSALVSRWLEEAFAAGDFH